MCPLVGAVLVSIQEDTYKYPGIGEDTCKYLLIGGPAPYWCAQDIIVSVTIIALPDLTSYKYAAINVQYPEYRI